MTRSRKKSTTKNPRLGKNLTNDKSRYRAQFRRITDFVYLLCKLQVLNKSLTVTIGEDQYSSAQDVMGYLIDKAFKNMTPTETAEFLSENLITKVRNENSK